MAGFFDGLYESTQNPLFLGGIGLMTGGAPAMMQGMQTGSGLQDRLKKQNQQASFIEALKGMPGVDQNTMAMLAANPELGQHVAGTMISNRLDPMADIKRKTAEANLAQTQAETGMFPLKQRLLQAQISAANQRGDGSFNQRAKAAQAFGLDPNSDAGRSYILTGKLPREDQQSLTATDKKAILEADENVGVNRSGMQAIDQAKALSPKANSGWGANLRAQIGANLPDMMVPDFISSPESSQATLDFDNAVVGQALGQLKATFGGNPTEGERKILLDLQGASNKPVAVRDEILKRARIAADNRLRLNEQRAIELRGGQYYKPGGGSAAANPMSHNSTSGDPLAEAKAAISKGADQQRVMQRLQQMGIDPRGLQ
jgi:hypothetical protein